MPSCALATLLQACVNALLPIHKNVDAQEANRIFGAIESALKATEEIAAARAALTQQQEVLSQPGAKSQGAASSASSQQGANENLYGSSPEGTSSVLPAAATPSQEQSEAPTKEGEASAFSPGKGASGPVAGRFRLRALTHILQPATQSPCVVECQCCACRGGYIAFSM